MASASAHLEGGNSMEMEELIDRHEDVQEVICPAPEMSRITFKTYEEITLDIPIDD